MKVAEGGRQFRRRDTQAAKQKDRFQEVLVALRRIIRATDLHSKQLSKTFGLTTPQVYVLQAIHELGEVTTGRLSERVNLSQATVTTIMDRLENRGLIERYRSLADRRVVHARLTVAGRRVVKKAPPLLQERFIAAFAALAQAHQERIITAIEEVADMMGAGQLDAAPLLAVGSPAVDDNAGGVRKAGAGPKAAFGKPGQGLGIADGQVPGRIRRRTSRRTAGESAKPPR